MTARCEKCRLAPACRRVPASARSRSGSWFAVLAEDDGCGGWDPEVAIVQQAPSAIEECNVVLRELEEVADDAGLLTVAAERLGDEQQPHRAVEVAGCEIAAPHDRRE